MALNGKFPIVTNINGIDYSAFTGVDKINFNKNLDHTQVFSKITLNLANNVGKSSNVSENDLFDVSINANKNFYNATSVVRGQSNVKIQLTNIFETLKNKSFLIIDDAGATVINPVLAEFVTGTVIDDPSLHTLIKMIASLALGEVRGLDADSIDINEFDPITGVITPISAFTFFSTDCAINENYLVWMGNTKPDSLLKDLQTIFCFTLNASGENFFMESLPIMKISKDYTLAFNSYIDPDFMKLGQIKKYLNPLENVSKSSYTDSSEFIQAFKTPLIVKDVIDVVDDEEDRIYYQPVYREFAKVETIELPKYLNLTIDGEIQVFKPLQFEFSSPKYVLKKGYYPAYMRYFSETDISQDAETKLSYLNSRGYDKIKYVFTNELSDTDLTDQKQPREITWDNANFFVYLTCNIPSLYNVARD